MLFQINNNLNFGEKEKKWLYPRFFNPLYSTLIKANYVRSGTHSYVVSSHVQERETKHESSDGNRRLIVVPAGSSSTLISSPDRLEYNSETDTIDGYGSDDDDESPHKDGYSETESNAKYYSNSSPLSLIPVSANNQIYSHVPHTAMFNRNLAALTIGQFLPNIGGFNGAASNFVQTTSKSNNDSGVGPAECSSPDDRKRAKRNRTFIDPATEVPRLEEWFQKNRHPSQHDFLDYTDTLNGMLYRQKSPKLEMKNVQFWFKNRRAKDKRLKVSLHDSLNNNLSSPNSYNQSATVSLNTYTVDTLKNHDLNTVTS